MATDTATLERTGRSIVAGTWGCAAIVMIGSATNAFLTYGALGDNRALGLATGIAVDIALCVALIGDRRLYVHGLSSNWGRALRITAALMSLVLNAGLALRDGHLFQAFLHSFLPILLIVVTEYGQSVLLAFAGLIRARGNAASADVEQTMAARAERAELELTESRRERERINTELTSTQSALAAERTARTANEQALRDAQQRQASNGHGPPHPATTPEERRAWAKKRILAGETITGATVDKQFPGSPRDGHRIVKTVKQELENEPTLRSIAAGER
jgi:hypothetical protein